MHRLGTAQMAFQATARGFQGIAARPGPQTCYRRCRSSRPAARAGRLAVRATSWDPEGLFKSTPQTGLIERKLLGQRVQADAEVRQQVEAFQKQQREEVEARRAARVVPEHDDQLIEYLLSTDAEDMEYEIARLRPRLAQPFFAELDKLIGLERLNPLGTPDEERLAELEGMRDYLTQALAAVDKAMANVTAPAERLRKLLSAADKKATLLDMAAANEIDEGLLALLRQNIEGARASGQDDAAEFMQKVLTAALRYRI